MTDDAEGWPTTRRFPRTMTGTDSAFPRDPEYAEPIQRFERALSWIENRWVLLFIAGGCVGALLAILKKSGVM